MLKDDLADRARDPGNDAQLGQVRDVPRAVRARVRRRRSLAVAADSDRRAVRVDRRLHLHPESAVLRGHHRGADVPDRHPGRARARGARRQRHDRSHLAGGIDSGRQPGREVPDLEGRAAVGLQLVRRAARQSRSDDARHVREHPPAQPARAGHRGRLDDAPAGRRGDDDLRRVGELSRRAACR